MDFDDLEDCEGASGPSPQARRTELLAAAKAEPLRVETPEKHRLGQSQRLKLAFLHGGGTNDRCSMPQVQNILQQAGCVHSQPWREMIEVHYFCGPHPVPWEWHLEADMREVMRAFAPNYYVYWDFVPPLECAGCNHLSEDWAGFDETLEKFGEFLEEKGPFDGLMGFDMGAAAVLQAARRAAEGDAPFAKKFHFVAVFTPFFPGQTTPKAWARPKAPLDIPAFISFSEGDFSRPYATMEEAALFFVEEKRVVARHKDGHQPPRLLEGLEPTKRLSEFLLGMFRSPGAWRAPEGEDLQNKALQGIWLPIARSPAPLPEKVPGARQVLLVVQEPDLGKRASDYVKELADAKYGPLPPPTKPWPPPFAARVPEAQSGGTYLRNDVHAKVAALTAEDFRAAVAEGGDGGDVEILGAQYAEEDAGIEWGTPARKLPTIVTLDPHDIVLDGGKQAKSKLTQARSIASSVLEQVSVVRGDVVGIVGVGSGAFIALQLAIELVRTRGSVPAGFWAVHGPPVMPPEVTGVMDIEVDGPGQLVDCPVRYLYVEGLNAVAPWRWEVQTLGPFSAGVVTDAAEVPRAVVREWRERLAALP